MWDDVFFSPFSIAITLLGEERANLSAFHTFVRLALVWFCLFTLPHGVMEGLRFVIVALPGLFSYLFFYIKRCLGCRLGCIVCYVGCLQCCMGCLSWHMRCLVCCAGYLVCYEGCLVWGIGCLICCRRYLIYSFE